MAHFVIDLMGDEDVITVPRLEDPEEERRIKEMQRRALEEIFRRAPVPQLIPVEVTR